MPIPIGISNILCMGGIMKNPHVLIEQGENGSPYPRVVDLAVVPGIFPAAVPLEEIRKSAADYPPGSVVRLREDGTFHLAAPEETA